MEKIFIFVSFVLLLNQFCIAKELAGKLVFSQIIMRHGERTPLQPYPNDPWKDLDNWPNGWGELTNVGKCQPFNLGKWLRKRYDSLLNTTYSEDEIYVQSTDLNRTKMSAEAVLNGIYEPEKECDPNMEWFPISLHTIPYNSDNVLAGQINCPVYDKAMLDLMKSDEFKQMQKKNSEIYDYISKFSGKLIQTTTDVADIMSTIYIEDLHNKTLPEWTKRIYPNPEVDAISAFSFAEATYTRPMALLKSGILLKEIFSHFELKFNGTLKPDRSIWIYSAHDRTIGNFMNTLKLFDKHCPPFTATLMLEMRILNEVPLISIFYKNTTSEPEPIFIPGCGLQCSLKFIQRLYDDVVPKNWEAVCRNYVRIKGIMPHMARNSNEHQPLMISLSIAAVSFLTYVLFVVLCSCNTKFMRQRQRSLYNQI